ncbi:MAG: methanogenesis marker 9 domain-containing protein [Candidatus Methanoperedens sp.]|nr:methanogenesis marker 9 domain-containing protein [Candidatus Methanoperedens sp.]MCZ7394250.1 methanogenesis marker 9 domain-containing protein [Candidatus Methanoperedens sp.]
MESLFDIRIGYASPRNPIALASMAGITDSKFASRFRNAGLVILGGYNLDKQTNDAAGKEIARGRSEFVSDEPMEFLKNELEAAIAIGTTIAVNVRAATLPPYVDAAHLAKKFGGILEINAHCRQPEMTELGAGEALLKDAKRLCDYIKEIKKTGVVLSVKTRANVVNDVELARAIEKAGADIIHIDAMHPEGMDIGVIRRVRNSTGLFIIGNNLVVDFESAKEMFSHGADMVSVARAALATPDIINRLVLEVSSFQSMTGWYNAPKHICGGGDLRALAFCCLPVKPCALHGALKQAGISAEEFMKLKTDFARKTPIEYGEGTCFGSMTWCCKITKPCFLRDGALVASGLSDVEYMRIKKRLSEYIMKHRKKI